MNLTAAHAPYRASPSRLARRMMLVCIGLAAMALGLSATEIRRAPDLRVGRAVHTVTALTDGRFLVAGGFSVQPRPVALAEIFDPATGDFRTIGPLTVPRFGHTASLLPDGTVLIAGGWEGNGSVLAAAELFDPATESFRPLPPMHTARAGQVAVVLADGRVLLMGGVGNGQVFLASAETFDSRTGRFTPVGSLNDARENHAAVRLADGRVLVSGGHHGHRATLRILASTELFDPATNRFSPAGPLLNPRHKHDAVLLTDGRVLVTCGASRGDEPGNTTEIYDPVRGEFSSGPRMSFSRFKHTGTSFALEDGTALVLGGGAEAERYRPNENRFERIPILRSAGAERYASAARSADGSILLAGGYGDGIRTSRNAWLIRPSSDASLLATESLPLRP